MFDFVFCWVKQKKTNTKSGKKKNNKKKTKVLKLPANAKVLASSEKTPYEMYSIDDRVLSIQGHPEFPEPYVEYIIDARYKMGLFDEKIAKDAKQSMKIYPPHNTEWSQLLTKWLKTPIEKK